MVALITHIALKVVASITVTATPDLCDETTYSTSVRFRAVVAITVVLPILSRQAVRNDGGRGRRCIRGRRRRCIRGRRPRRGRAFIFSSRPPCHNLRAARRSSARPTASKLRDRADMVLLLLRGSSACPRCVDTSRTTSRSGDPVSVSSACVERARAIWVLEGMIRFPLLRDLAQVGDILGIRIRGANEQYKCSEEQRLGKPDCHFAAFWNFQQILRNFQEIVRRERSRDARPNRSNKSQFTRTRERRGGGEGIEEGGKGKRGNATRGLRLNFLDEAADEDEKAAPPKDGSIDRVYPFSWPPEICVGGSRARIFQVDEKPKKERRVELLLDKNPRNDGSLEEVRVPEPNTLPRTGGEPSPPPSFILTLR